MSIVHQIKMPTSMNRICWLILVLSLFIGEVLKAQTPQNFEVIISRDVEPVINSSQKYYDTPVNTDTVKVTEKINYEFNAQKINTVYELDPIKAANVKNEPLAKLYKGLVKGGWGNYSSPFFELFYNTARKKEYQTGIHYRHFSSTGQLKNVGFSGFSQNRIDAYGKTFIGKNTLKGDISYDRNVWHYYGFNPKDPELVSLPLNRSDIKQQYQMVKANVDFADNLPVDSLALKYKIGAGFYNLRDINDFSENYFKLQGNVDYFYKEFKVNGLLKVENWNNKMANDTSSNTIIQFRPAAKLNREKFKLTAALNTYFTSGNQAKTYIAPEVDIELVVYKNMLLFNLGTDSRLNRNSYASLISENPFINAFTPLRNTWSPFRLYAGLKGSLSSKTSFNTQISYNIADNWAYFVNDSTFGRRNQMTVVYDNPQVLKIMGEVFHQRNEKLKLSAKAEIFNIAPDAELQAWHTPTFRTTFTGRYNLKDKIVATASIFTFSRQYGRAFNTTTDSLGVKVVTVEQIKIKGFFDLNLGAEYRYNKRMSGFIQVNNLLAVRWERFLGFPTQRINVLAGLTYAF